MPATDLRHQYVRGCCIAAHVVVVLALTLAGCVFDSFAFMSFILGPSVALAPLVALPSAPRSNRAMLITSTVLALPFCVLGLVVLVVVSNIKHGGWH
jgi:hypothetical protein